MVEGSFRREEPGFPPILAPHLYVEALRRLSFGGRFHSPIRQSPCGSHYAGGRRRSSERERSPGTEAFPTRFTCERGLVAAPETPDPVRETAEGGMNMGKGGLALPQYDARRTAGRHTGTVTAVIPAYNEEHRIRGVVEAVKRSEAVERLIVVSDGSTDRTYDVVKDDPDVFALQLPRNLGKGGAMVAGAMQANTDWLLFFDADLMGLSPNHVHALLRPVLTREADMAVGIFQGGRFLTDLAQCIAPSITGQRVVSRRFFLSLPGITDVRYGVEMAIGFHARRQGMQIQSVVLDGVTHPLKEEKLGAFQGGKARMRMYYEMGKYVVHASRTNSGSRRAAPAWHERPPY